MAHCPPPTDWNVKHYLFKNIKSESTPNTKISEQNTGFRNSKLQQMYTCISLNPSQNMQILLSQCFLIIIIKIGCNKSFLNYSIVSIYLYTWRLNKGLIISDIMFTISINNSSLRIIKK